MIGLRMPIVSAVDWDRFLEHHPEANLLQTSAWGEFKQVFGWHVVRVCAGEAGAQVLFRRLPLGFHFAYLPKGPVGGQSVQDWEPLWPEIDRVCRAKRTILLKVEPDLAEPASEAVLSHFQGFIPSDPVQPRRTILISLEGDEAQWLERMKQKTRYNIRLAERKDVKVRSSQDIGEFYRLMESTGERDGFGIHSQAYYQKVYDLFSARGQCELLIAEYQDRPLAGLMVFAQGARAWYLYGASNEEERNRMPTYLLQWEAMRWAASKGCREYDLVGVPDAEEEELEANFTNRSDGLWGVYRFKRGFGGKLVRSVGAWDREYFPFAHAFYRWWRNRRGGAE